MQNPPIAVETSHHSSSVTVSIFGALSEILSQTTESLSFLTSTTTERSPLSHTHSTFLSTGKQPTSSDISKNTITITSAITNTNTDDNDQSDQTNAFDPNEATLDNPSNHHTSHEQVDAITINSVTQMNTITSTISTLPTTQSMNMSRHRNDAVDDANHANEISVDRQAKSTSSSDLSKQNSFDQNKNISKNSVTTKPNVMIVNSVSADAAQLNQMYSFVANNESNANHSISQSTPNSSIHSHTTSPNPIPFVNDKLLYPSADSTKAIETTTTQTDKHVTDNVHYVTPEKTVNIFDFMQRLNNDSDQLSSPEINGSVTDKTPEPKPFSDENVTEVPEQTMTNHTELLTDLTTTKSNELTTNELSQIDVTTIIDEDTLTMTMHPTSVNAKSPENSDDFPSDGLPSEITTIDSKSAEEITTITKTMDEVDTTEMTSERYVPRFGKRLPILPIGFYAKIMTTESFKSLPTTPPMIADEDIQSTQPSLQEEMSTRSSEIETTTMTRSVTTHKPRRFDFFIYGILPNNSVVRKYPEDFYDERDESIDSNPDIVYGILSNNTVLRKYPNGTIEIDMKRSSRKFEVTNIDPKSLLNPNSDFYLPQKMFDKPIMGITAQTTPPADVASAKHAINHNFNELLNPTNRTMNTRSNSHNTAKPTISTTSHNSSNYNIANSTTDRAMVFKLPTFSLYIHKYIIS